MEKGVLKKMIYIQASAVSHLGNSRTNQEDSSIIIYDKRNDFGSHNLFSSVNEKEIPDKQIVGESAILAVSDGMGGHSFGEVASRLTVKYLAERYYAFAQGGKNEIVAEIAKLNQTVVSVSKENPSYKGMGATLCGILLREDKNYVFNVGDSRAYQFYNGELLRLTRDHTEGQRLLDLKLLSFDELATFPKRKSLYKYIGTKSDLVAEVFEKESFEKGSILLLCSDGLTDVVTDAEIQNVLSKETSLKNKREELLGMALARNIGCGDNITMILIQL